MRPAILLLLCVLSSICGAQTLRLDSDENALAAAPGEVVAVSVGLENSSSRPLSLLPTVVLPAGWRLLLPLVPVSVAPSERELLLAMVVVPSTAAAGMYGIEFRLESGEASYVLQRELVVSEQRSIHAELVRAPPWAVGAAYTVVFVVRNTGNVTEELSVEAVGSSGLQPAVRGGAELLLPPGASEEVEVEVEVAGAVPEPAARVVTLYVRRASEVVAAVSSSTRMAAPASAQGLLDRTFDLEVTAGLTPGFPRSKPGSTPLGTFDVSVSGSGRLSEDQPGELSISLTTSARGDNLISYLHPQYLFELGDIRAEGELFPDEEGFGVAVSTPGVWRDRQRLRALAVVGEKPFWEVGAGGPLSESLDFSAEGRFGEETTLLSAGISFEPGSLSLEARQAFDLTTFAPATAIGLELDSRLLRASIDLEYLSTGFAGAALPESEYTVSLVVPFENGASDYEVYAGLWDADEAGSTNEGARLELLRRGHGGDWTVGYLEHRSTSEDGTFHRRDAYLRSVLPVGSLELSPRLSLRHQRDLGEGSSLRILNAGVGVGTELLGGRFRPDFDAEYDLAEQRPRRLEMTARWNRRFSHTDVLDLYASVAAIEEAGWRLGLFGSHALGPARTLSVDMNVRDTPSSPLSVQADLEVSFPLHLPIGRRTDVGEVSGTISDSSGTSLPDLTVWIGGFTSETDERGYFRFPAVPVGSYPLTVDGLPPGSAVEPALPHLLEVHRAQEVEVNVHVFDGSFIVGKVNIGESAQGSSPFLAPERPPADELISGLVLVLEGPNSTRRSLVGTDGTAEFARLIPGEWQLQVLPESVPDGYRAEPSERRLDLAESSTEEVLFELVPVVRRIQFQDGGVVGN